MKISFIIPGFFKSGGMRVIYEISNGLVNKGHDVTLYNPVIPFNFFQGELSLKSLRHYNWNLKSVVYNKQNSEYFSSGNFKIRSVLRINNFSVDDSDVVIATAWPTAFSVKALKKSKGRKFYFIQGYETWNSNIVKVDESYKLGLNSITTCRYLQELMYSKFKVKSAKIFIGINDELFSNADKKYTKAKTISFIHNGLDLKNTPLAIKILKSIKKSFPEVKIISFGTLAYPGLPDFVESYLNPSEKLIKEIYSKSDIFLFTSKVEGFGLPPSEAMACKSAVVTTNVGAIPEYCENGISAFIHDPEDENGMIESISKLISDEKLLMDMSEKGYESVKSKLNWTVCINKFEKHLIANSGNKSLED